MKHSSPDQPKRVTAGNPATLIVVCAVGLFVLGLPTLFSATASFDQGPFYYLIKQMIGPGGGGADGDDWGDFGRRGMLGGESR